MRFINKQRGISLISLMVGTALSMLSILAMLALYKNLIQVSVTATQHANHDGGLASAMLTTQLVLQGAGFGMSEPVENLVRLPNKNTLFWRYKNAGQDASCSGLWFREHPNKTEKDYYTLTLLYKEACNNAEFNTVSATGSDWDTTTNLAVLTHETNLAELTFEKTDTVCGHYGASADSNTTIKHPQITITAMNSSALHNKAPDQLKTAYTVCLSNISVPDTADGENDESSP